jgi:hypothetical protein
MGQGAINKIRMLSEQITIKANVGYSVRNDVRNIIPFLYTDPLVASSPASRLGIPCSRG